MQNKYSVWLNRIESALRNQHLRVTSQVWQERQSSFSEEKFDDGADPATEQALQEARVESDVHALSMPLLQAEALCQALRAACQAAEGPDVVSCAALDYLATLVGVSQVMQLSAKVRGRFASATLTYQGDFDAFKSGLRYGVSSPQNEFSTAPTLHIRNVRIPEKTFDRQEGSDFLSTCRVSAEVEFEVSLLTEDCNVALEQLVRDCVALIGHEVQPVPTQRVNLQDVKLSEVSYA